MREDQSSIADAARKVKAGAGRTSGTGFFRSLVERVLSRLAHGQIVLHDGDDERVFGQDTSSRATITVDHKGFYRSLALNGSIGAAESYMRGEWRVDDLVLLVQLMVRNRSVLEEVDSGLTRTLSWVNRFHHRLRSNSLSGSRKNIVAHYGLSNDFYRLFLDRTMTYSSAVFPHQGASLEEASLEKIHRICRKLKLSPDDQVLEIGTGWGSFATEAAARYGCRVTTTTISDEQYAYAKQLVEQMGLADRVTVLNRDYRTLVGEYDKIISIEMIEAVGYKYIPAFFKQCHHLLKADGAMALQAITMSDHLFDSYRRSVDFIQRYVFPGACLVSMQQVYSTLKERTDFRVIHVEDITSHYAQTLRCWRERYMQHLDDVRELGFSEQFVRLWEFYLAYCEGGFRERQIGTVQMILARQGYRNDGDLDLSGAPHV